MIFDLSSVSHLKILSLAGADSDYRNVRTCKPWNILLVKSRGNGVKIGEILNKIGKIWGGSFLSCIRTCLVTRFVTSPHVTRNMIYNLSITGLLILQIKHLIILSSILTLFAANTVSSWRWNQWRYNMVWWWSLSWPEITGFTSSNFFNIDVI